MRWSLGSGPYAAAVTLLLIAPLAAGALRSPGLAFAPLITLCAVAAYFFFDRVWRPDGSATIPACLGMLYALTLPGIIAGAGARYYAFYYLLVLLVFAQLLWFADRNVVLRLLVVLVSTLVILIGLVFAGHALTAGVLPTRTVLFAIYQTNYEEAVAYLTAVVGTSTVVAMTMVLLALVVLLARARALAPRLSFPYQAVICVPVVVGLWVTADGSNELRVLTTSLEYRSLLREYRRVAAERRTTAQDIEAAQTRAEPEVHVIVIGESTTRNHMGLYGYFRDTTPHLSGMAEDLVVFTDVISSHSHTMHALQKALTLASVDNQLDYTDSRAYSIIELLNAAGVRTYWLSNQKRFGLWDDHVTVLAEAADQITFVSRRLGKRVQPGPDARVLPAFREALRDGRSGSKVIFVHLMGTHWPYEQRTDRRHARFAGRPGPALVGGLELDEKLVPEVNHYDNAVLYADFILKGLIDILAEDGPAASSLLYFSDHGESPLEGTGHDASRFSRGHVEIPFLFWFSEGFRESHPDLIDDLRRNADKRFMTDRLEHVILDLVGLATEHLEPEASLLRPEFAEVARRALDGKLDYDRYDDPLLRAKANLRQIREHDLALGERLWAHRVNSLGKLSEAIGLFAGVELDLVFNAERNVFEVRHPPVPHTGLTLEDVLGFLRRQDAATALWLDIKNIGHDNLGQVVERLVHLDEHYGFKERSIVETGFTGAGLDRLAARGFYVSYYLPTRRIRTALREDDRQALEQLAAEIAGVAKTHQARAISFDFGLRPFVDRHLSAWPAARDLDLLTWDLAVSSAEQRFARRLARRPADDRIKVILVPFPSRFDI